MQVKKKQPIIIEDTQPIIIEDDDTSSSQTSLQSVHESRTPSPVRVGNSCTNTEITVQSMEALIIQMIF